MVLEHGDKQQHHHHHHDHHNVANRLHQPYLCYHHHHRIQTKIVNAVIVIIMVIIARISFGSSVSVFSARMSMHAAMARLFVLLAVCISLYTARQRLHQPSRPHQPNRLHQPNLCFPACRPNVNASFWPCGASTPARRPNANAPRWTCGASTTSVNGDWRTFARTSNSTEWSRPQARGPCSGTAVLSQTG